MRRGRPRHDDVLTPREWEVLALLRQNLTNDQIAGQLAISANTAKFHVSEILTKLGVSSREEAVLRVEGRVSQHFSLPFLTTVIAKLKGVSGLLGFVASGVGG